MSTRTYATLLAAALTLAAVATHAQQQVAVAKQVPATGSAVSAQEIVIGHVSGYTGPVSKDAIELGAGAQVAIAAANERGGFEGKKFRLLAVDDGFKPDNTVKMIEEMKGKAIALLPTTGSANAAAMVKANTLELPLVGTIPSPDIVRTWQNKYMFHIRASDREQTERILEQLITVGLTNIALMVPNNPFGEQSTKIAEAYLAGRNHKLVANAIYLLAGPKADVTPGLKVLEGKSYQALVVFGPPKHCADVVRDLKTRGETAQIYALSYADSKLIVKTAGGELAHGVVISQVMPNLNTKTMPLIRQFRAEWEKYTPTKGEPTHFNIEGYIAARLIIEAVRRTRDPSAEGVRKGLEQLRNYDLGGYIVDFSPGKRQGSSFVDLAVIGAKGELVY
jgi:ABC-type branched-subunit amino acid transport system substrate-binding protein